MKFQVAVPPVLWNPLLAVTSTGTLEIQKIPGLEIQKIPGLEILKFPGLRTVDQLKSEGLSDSDITALMNLEKAKGLTDTEILFGIVEQRTCKRGHAMTMYLHKLPFFYKWIHRTVISRGRRSKGGGLSQSTLRHNAVLRRLRFQGAEVKDRPRCEICGKWDLHLETLAFFHCENCKMEVCITCRPGNSPSVAASAQAIPFLGHPTGAQFEDCTPVIHATTLKTPIATDVDAAPIVHGSGGADLATELEKLAKLHEKGFLNETQFEKAKNKLLGF